MVKPLSRLDEQKMNSSQFWLLWIQYDHVQFCIL